MNSTNITNQSTTTQRSQTFEIRNHLDFQYLTILNKIKEQGVTKTDRTGVGTKSLFGTQIRVKMGEGFPLLTSKRMFTKGIIIELLWFLGKHMQDIKYRELGRNNIKYMVDNGCNIWIGDIYKKYCAEYDKEFPPFSSPFPHLLTIDEFIYSIRNDDHFAKTWGDLGPVYGSQWCQWRSHGFVDIDQISNLIESLCNNPDSRRLLVSAWNVDEIDNMVLPPCHYSFQFWTRELSKAEREHILTEKYGIDISRDGHHDSFLDERHIPKRAISLMWNQRSADYPLGKSMLSIKLLKRGNS